MLEGTEAVSSSSGAQRHARIARTVDAATRRHFSKPTFAPEALTPA
jgi:hypothetical protein